MTDETTERPGHPAQFSDRHLEAIARHLADEATRLEVERLDVLDSFAGTGRIHLLPHNTVGVELEPEWAGWHPETIVGDATDLVFPDESFDAYATSITFANRMADQYDGSGDRCKAAGCGKAGAAEGWRLATDADPFELTDEVPHATSPLFEGTVVVTPCSACGGSGRAPSSRRTYRISLGRPLSPGNAGGLQWGKPWRVLHRQAFAEAVRVVKPAGLVIVNVQNHVRSIDGVETFPPVVEFCTMALARLGCYVVSVDRIETSGYGFGQNSDRRAATEHLLVYRKGRPTLRADVRPGA